MSTLTVGTIAEKVVDAGVTIDGVILKDSAVLVDTISEQGSGQGVTIDGVTLKDSTIIVGADTLTPAQVVQKNIQNTFTKAQVPSVYTGTDLTLDYDTYQNFILTISSGL